MQDLLATASTIPPEVAWITANIFVVCFVFGFGLFILAVAMKHLQRVEKKEKEQLKPHNFWEDIR